MEDEGRGFLGPRGMAAQRTGEENAAPPLREDDRGEAGLRSDPIHSRTPWARPASRTGPVARNWSGSTSIMALGSARKHTPGKAGSTSPCEMTAMEDPGSRHPSPVRRIRREAQIDIRARAATNAHASRDPESSVPIYASLLGQSRAQCISPIPQLAQRSNSGEPMCA